MSTSTSSTFSQALDTALRADPARPLVTFYDDATGERVELSVTTYANWVSKTANLAQDELDVERGGLLLVDLPTHWLGAVWLGAAWLLGLTVSTAPDDEGAADLVVCGPEGVPRYSPEQRPVVAVSLRPLGGRFVEELPPGVVDYGAVVLAQPDAFVGTDPPGAQDPAFRVHGGTSSQEELLAAAGRSSLIEPGGRLLTDVNPCSREGLETLLVPLLRSGGTVWVANPDPEGWARREDEERATARLRGPRLS